MCPWSKLTFSGDRIEMELFRRCCDCLLGSWFGDSSAAAAHWPDLALIAVLFFAAAFSVSYKKKSFSFFIIHKRSRTPGSRQPSPAEEAVTRPQTLLDPNAFHHQQFQHMLNASMEHHTHAGQLNSFHPPLMNHQMQGAVMNGVNGLQVPQVSKPIR